MSRIIVDSIRNSSASSDGITLSSDGKVAFPNTSTGKILQVVQTVKTDTLTTTSVVSSGGYEDLTGLAVTITPQSASNKILCKAIIYNSVASNNVIFFRINCFNI